MSLHLLHAIDNLKKQILALGAVVEGAVESAVAATRGRDDELARQVIAGDQAIDKLEVVIEEDCLKILALHQPVAQDLRFIVGVLKMNHEMERIGDMAVNLAKRALDLSTMEPVTVPYDLEDMTRRTLWMVHACMDCLVGLDGELARDVWTADKGVDAIHRQSFADLRDAMMARPEQVPQLIHYLGISRFLERIADNATNIAKDVLYLLEGEIVRHRGKEFRRPEAEEDA